MSRPVFRSLGIAFWAAVILATAYFMRSSWQPTGTTGDVTLARYLLKPPAKITAKDPTKQIRVNDPVFYRDQANQWRQIGYVTKVALQHDHSSVTLAWYLDSYAPDECRLTQFHNSGKLEDVVATMLPPEKRRRIQQRLATVMSAHGEELSAAFVPLVQETLRQSLPVIEDELRKSVAAHRNELDSFAQRWNEEIINEKLLPLARQEIIPIVRHHGQPPAEQIGQELWNRASLFRFGWRAVYDNTPLPRRDLVKEEWDRFVEEEAVPVFEAHMDEIVVAVEGIVRDIAANEVIRHELGEVAEKIATDPDVQQFVRTIMRETLIENERLREVWAGVWQSDQARSAFDLAGDRLEPIVRQIGDDLFGTKETGIDPNFARVLRNQILGKDRRWIVASVAADKALASGMTIQLSNQSAVYPIIHTAESIEDAR
tara:strand:- start:530928 stop:532214 length:1287 start_codon:yes stop_codon:yes gene_type:complete